MPGPQGWSSLDAGTPGPLELRVVISKAFPVRRISPLAIVAAVLFSAAAGATALYFVKSRKHKKRQPEDSATIATAFGAVEYATLGKGEPVLVLHGPGGGYDQGLHMAEPLAKEGYQLIAPSRFGYLRSDMPTTATPALQADAYAELLDRLGIAKAVVLAISSGACSALHFAKNYPARCSALVLLVPAANLPSGGAIYGGVLARFLFRSKCLGGTLLRLAATFPRLGASLVGTPLALLYRLPRAERDRIFQLLLDGLPARDHAVGMAFDIDTAQPAGTFPFADIHCPVLAISAADDAFKTAARAKEIAKAVPFGSAVIFPNGGHILVNRLDEALRTIKGFLKRQR